MASHITRLGDNPRVGGRASCSANHAFIVRITSHEQSHCPAAQHDELLLATTSAQVSLTQAIACTPSWSFLPFFAPLQHRLEVASLLVSVTARTVGASRSQPLSAASARS